MPNKALKPQVVMRQGAIIHLYLDSPITPTPLCLANCFTGNLRFSAKNGPMTLHDRHMNLHDAVKTFNQRAAREKWYYFCDPTLAFSDSLL